MLSAISTSTNQCIRLGRKRGESADGDEPKTTTMVVPSTVQSTVGFPDDFFDPRMKIGQVFGVQVNFPNCWMQLLGNKTRQHLEYFANFACTANWCDRTSPRMLIRGIDNSNIYLDAIHLDTNQSWSFLGSAPRYIARGVPFHCRAIVGRVRGDVSETCHEPVYAGTSDEGYLFHGHNSRRSWEIAVTSSNSNELRSTM